MKRFAWLLILVVLVACSSEPESFDYHGGEPDTAEGEVDPWTPEDVADPDVLLPEVSADSSVTEDNGETPEDATTLPDEESPEDVVAEEVTENDSGGEEPPECGDHKFEYWGPEAGEVFVAGSFNDWSDSANPLTNDGGTWSAVLSLTTGKHTYKFVVDGAWIPDPGNPDGEDDGYGSTNSVLWVDDCDAPATVELKEHDTDSGSGTFFAKFESTGTQSIDEGQVAVTVDWKSSDQFSVSADGKTLEVEIGGLSDGIHDVRVTVGEETFLLKVYIGISTDWRETTLYFVMTDRFSNGDASNDEPYEGVDWRTNYQGGDFKGITDRIEDGYFDDLGVTAIWISWPVDNPDWGEDGGYPAEHYCGMNPKTAPYAGTKYTGYHGYWPSNLYETEEHFGTMDELQAMVTTAHSHGIRILLDFTANHVHSASPFFQDHSDDNYFHLPAEICQDVGWDEKPVTCWFVDYLPDLNYSNPAAIDEVLDYAMFWAKETGSDGFRLDAVKHIEFDFIYKLRQRVKKEMELTGIDFYIVGETFTGDAGLINSFLGPDKIHGQLDFPANMQILKGFAKREIGLDEMDNEIRSKKAVYGDAVMSTFLGNHDIARFISLAGGQISCGIWDVVSNIAQGWHNPPDAPGDVAAYKKLQLAFAYVMTVPGIPLIYYGDEFGMPGAGDPDNRRMMRFGNDLNQNEKDTLAFLKKLGKARKNHPVLGSGAWSAPLWSEGDFLAYARTSGAVKAVILINIGSGTKSGELDVSGIGLDGGVTDLISGSGGTVSGGKMPFSLNGLSAAIFVGD